MHGRLHAWPRIRSIDPSPSILLLRPIFIISWPAGLWSCSVQIVFIIVGQAKLHLTIQQSINFINKTQQNPQMNTSTLKTYKTNPSRSKSQSKSATSPRKTIGSPSNAQKKIARVDEPAISLKMKQMRQRLCTTLDAYVLILETNAPMRCLEHNSVLSLYCETEQKLLCANCVYRTNNHKLHRVFPMEKCYKQISRDVDQMSRQVERQAAWAEGATKSIFEFFKQEQKNTNEALLNLTQVYEQIQYQLSKSFEQTKKRLILAMQGVFTKKQSLLLQLQFFRDIYTKNKPTNLDKLQHQSDPSTTEYHLLFNHLIGNALLEFGKIENTRINDGVSRIKMIERQEMIKLGEFKELMESWKGYQGQGKHQQQHRDRERQDGS